VHYGAERNGHAGAGVHFEPTTHYGLIRVTGMDVVLSLGPVGTVGRSEYDGRYSRTPVGAAMLALLSIPSVSLMMIGLPGPEGSERPSTTGSLHEAARGTVAYHTTGLVSPDVLFAVI